MSGRVIALCGLLAALPQALAGQAEVIRAQQELAALRLSHVDYRSPEESAAERAAIDAREAQMLYSDLERELMSQVEVQESLVHRDRRYVAEGKPAALVRKLAAEAEQAAADRRLRRWGRLGRGPLRTRLRSAEKWAMDAVEVNLYFEEKYRREICDKVLQLADQMERAAERKRRIQARQGSR